MLVLLLWISTCCFPCTSVQGNLQLIGSSQPITASPGDDVVLPCRVDPEWDAVGKTVEWSRPDLRPPGPQRRVEYVLVYRFKRTDRDMMMETYIQRTSLSEGGLRRGDVSLSIKNVSLEDNGRFRCFIPSLRKEAEVLLVVEPDFVKMTTTETLPDRNLISPTSQEETRRNARRYRQLLCLPVLLFFVCLSAVSISVIQNDDKTRNFFRDSETQTPHLHPECSSLQQTRVDVDDSSADSGSSSSCSSGFTHMKQIPVDVRLEKKQKPIKTPRILLVPLQTFFSLRMN